MRLINTETLKLVNTYQPSEFEYAILSHRWMSGPEGEATLQLFEQYTASHSVWWNPSHNEYEIAAHNERSNSNSVAMNGPESHIHSGIRKVIDFCRVAKIGGYEFAWADTDVEAFIESAETEAVCIDKTSSAELSESINSMYEWYRLSHWCYVHLNDFDKALGEYEAWKSSHWFSRGFTLQELIAPQNTTFCDRNWKPVAEKWDSAESLSLVTGIPSRLLKAPDTILDYNSAQRLSWAAKRRTSRPEDIAYCLLGICNVNMELLYGEGPEKAFRRLQIKILEEYEDESILAWRYHASSDDRDPIQITLPDNTAISGKYAGILALSPDDFEGCGSIQRMDSLAATHALKVSSRGLEIQRSMDTAQGVNVTQVLFKWGKAIFCRHLPLLMLRLHCKDGEGTTHGINIWLTEDVNSRPVKRFGRILINRKCHDDLLFSLSRQRKLKAEDKRIYVRISSPSDREDIRGER